MVSRGAKGRQVQKQYYLNDKIEFTVRGLTYESPVIGYRLTNDQREYLVLWDGGWPLTPANTAERWPGVNLVNGHHNKRVTLICHSMVIGLAGPEIARAEGMKCQGPCGNFIYKAVSESDPKHHKTGAPWWCRTCRTDYGWQRTAC